MDIDIKIKKQIKKQESSNQESELISKKRIVRIKKDNFTKNIDQQENMPTEVIDGNSLHIQQTQN